MQKLKLVFLFLCCLLIQQLSAQHSKIYFSLKDALAEPTQVYKLNLSGNKLSKLPEDFYKLTNLTYLDLSNNELKDLPKEFSKLQNLKFLNLGLNNFKNIPDAVFELNQLQELFIFTNYINEISPKINKLKQLQTIDFTSNYVKEIPNELFELNLISEILAESNRIKEIPNGFLILKNLHTLLLGDNPINTIPTEVYKLQNLKYLSIPIKIDKSTEKITLRQSLKKTKISFNDFKEPQNNDTTVRNQSFNLKAKILRGNRASNFPIQLQNIKLREEESNSYISTFSDSNGDFEFPNLSIEKTYLLELENHDMNENENIYIAKSNGEILKTLKSDDNGNFVFEFLPQEIYTINTLKDEDAVLFTKRSNKANYETLTVYFKSASYELTEDDKQKLHIIINKLKKEPHKYLEVISHTDSRGDEKDNFILSKKRSEAVLNYLVQEGGIAKSKIKAVGMGETKLLNKCDDNTTCTEEEHKINRRTEFRFYTKK